MKIILGLGNPGKRYAGTRHNLGALAVTRLAGRLDVTLSHSTFHSQWGRGYHASQNFILALPQTFMNLSGQAARALVAHFKIAPDQLLVVSDDVHLPAGKLRLRRHGSAGGHNGLKSVIAELGHEDFPRLRIGVGESPERMDQADWVLGRLTAEEQPVLAECLEKAEKVMQAWLGSGLDAAVALAGQ